MMFSNLDTPIRWLFLAHAVAGALALSVFVIPLISRKGGKLHVRAGWIYIGAMVVVGFSALVLTPWRVFFDPSKTISSQIFSIFLFYISVFTLAAISFGLASIRSKNRKGSSHELALLAPPILTVLAGIATQIIGYQTQNILLMVFPFLGHVSSRTQLNYWLKAPTTKMHWWYAHMNGMGVACIATITAFLVTAVPRLWPGAIAESPALWVAPGLILGTVLNRWTAAAKTKFEKRLH